MIGGSMLRIGALLLALFGAVSGLGVMSIDFGAEWFKGGVLKKKRRLRFRIDAVF